MREGIDLIKNLKKLNIELDNWINQTILPSSYCINLIFYIVIKKLSRITIILNHHYK